MAASDKGFTVWIVGLASAGKSTVANLLEERLTERGYSPVLMEPTTGKELRPRVMPDLGFDKDGKNEITRRLGYVAGLVTKGGGVAIVPWIAPEAWARDEVRKEIGRFVEVYVECPMDVLEQRDDRGLYAGAKEKHLGVPGVYDPWGPPENPEVRVFSTKQTPEEEVEAVMAKLEELGYVKSSA